ncbi:MAG: hypothetical protein E3J56_13910 [Candidatus Aminicenantes bacterium]|nr:MAG: hypothetical protein E3J56_13910 [Candidatus Aminicenantes bacterium]
MRHIKGPWRVKPIPYQGLGDQYSYWIDTAKDDEPIADVRAYIGNKDEANARLIAKTPLMYEVISLTIRTIYDCFRHYSMSDSCKEILESLIKEELKPLLD